MTFEIWRFLSLSPKWVNWGNNSKTWPYFFYYFVKEDTVGFMIVIVFLIFACWKSKPQSISKRPTYLFSTQYGCIYASLNRRTVIAAVQLLVVREKFSLKIASKSRAREHVPLWDGPYVYGGFYIISNVRLCQIDIDQCKCNVLGSWFAYRHWIVEPWNIWYR